jgi:adenylate cyclase
LRSVVAVGNCELANTCLLQGELGRLPSSRAADSGYALRVSTERSRLLSSPLVARAREAGFSEADIMGLAQAYTRGISRIVAAESHVLARELVRVPGAQREQRARRWMATISPLAGPAFEELHVAQLEAAVESLLAGTRDRSPSELAVAFVDLCGSTEYMLNSSRDEIRALADGVFFASRDVAARHDVRVSKHLGDGVLLSGSNRPATIEAATELVIELERRTPLQAAAGVDFGTVTTRAGDLFGPPVNFAARLAEVACAREVLVGLAAVPNRPPNGVWASQTVRGVARQQRVLRLSCPPA